MRISLEIAHTVLDPDTKPGREFERSCVIGSDVHRALVDHGHDVDVVILIDDKRIGDDNGAEQVSTLLDKASEHAPVRAWASERRLQEYLEDLIELIRSPAVRESRRTHLNRYLDELGSPPCSTDIAIWQLLRLGVIKDKNRIITPISGPQGMHKADHVASVLPEYHEEYEQLADRDYLRRTEPSVTDRIHRLYFPAVAKYDRSKLERRVHHFASQFDAHQRSIANE